jgi:hypothetical protein
MMRFYFTFIFGKTGTISRIGEEQYYNRNIDAALTQFISRRLERITIQYFHMMTSALSIDMTQKRKLPNRYGIIKVEVLWSGAKRNGKGLQLSALAKSFSRSN